MKIESCIDTLSSVMFHGWEGRTGVTMINLHLPIIALANTLPIRVNGAKTYAFRCVELI